MKRFLYGSVGLVLLLVACGGGGDDEENTPWYDSTSGLTWQNPPAESSMTWSEAKLYCANNVPSLEGTDWRLPSINELRSLIRSCSTTEPGGMCPVTDNCNSSDCWNDGCEGCKEGASPVGGCHWPVDLTGKCSHYWTASPYEGEDGLVVLLQFVWASFTVIDQDSKGSVRCVRGTYGGPDMTNTHSPWTDSSTGLVWWQYRPNSGPVNLNQSVATWSEAKTYCANNSASLPGTGWRLPNISELRSLIRGCAATETGGACGIVDICPQCGEHQSCLKWDECKTDGCWDCPYCSGCSFRQGPGPGGYYWDSAFGGDSLDWQGNQEYWSSSLYKDSTDGAFYVKFSSGELSSSSISTFKGVCQQISQSVRIWT